MNSYLIKYKYINKFFKLFGGYDYDDCYCGEYCGCCGSDYSRNTSEGNTSSFVINTKRADVPLA